MFALLALPLGLVSLLLGMVLLPHGLTLLGQEKIKKAVTRFTSTPFIATITGTLVTMLFQSSSAVTVLSIGLVNAGTMTLAQGIGIILGSNIGTTVTAQLIAFDLFSLGPWLLAPACLLWFFPWAKTRALSQAIFGLALIFWGLSLMETALLPLRDSPRLFNWFVILGDNYLLALLVGMVATAIIQSGTAVIGLSLILSEHGLVSLPVAIAIMLGSNLGTCATALLAAATGTVDARRLALAHVLLNAVGAMLFFPLIGVFSQLLSLLSADVGRQIAHSHTIYNIFCSLLILPVVPQFARFICWLLPERERLG